MKPKTLLPLLVIFTAWVLFFSGLPDRMIIFRDSFPEFYPEWKFLILTYARGFFPLWNPFQYLGLPFLAQTFPAAFYPLLGLFFLLPFDPAFTHYLALHYLLAGIFMWLLLRRLALGPFAVTIGAVSYMESGYLVSMQGAFNYLAPLPWLPLLLFAFDHLLERPRRRTLLLVAALWAVPLLVGDPQSELIWLAILAAWLLLRGPAFHLPPRSGFFILAGLLALAGLLIAVQILPALELGPSLEKASGSSFLEITRWSFSPLRAQEWFFPSLHNFARPASAWALTTYFGLVPLLGLAHLFAYHRTRFALGLASLALFFLLLAFGHYTSGYKIFLLLPGVASFRYPEKFLAPVTFLVLILASLGLDRLEEAPGRGVSKQRLQRIFVAAAILAVVAILLREPGFGTDHTLAVSLILVIIFVAQFLQPKIKPLAPFALVLLAWLDLHTAHHRLLMLAPISLFKDEPRAAQILRELESGDSPPFRIHRNPLISRPSAFKDRTLASQRRFEHDTLLPNRAMSEGLVEDLGYTPARPQWVLDLARVSERRLWSLAGVRYVLWGLEGGQPPGAGELNALEEIRRLPDLNLVIYRDREALPRAYAVTGARWARDSIQAKRFLLDTDFSRQVILLGSGQDQPGKVLTPAPALELGEQRAEATIKLDQPGYLVLSDSYFPGWQARVNGTPVRIFRANYLVRAVPVPAGESRIVFLYRPWAFRIGLWISLATFCGLLWPRSLALARPR